ncbi:MAG: winged helix-turn-helix transcriptional regulator [Anaerolineales bacterium]|nr:winged helix-turn-helix transcriptional regulator [Anaerolineales bacterium]
MNKELYLWDLQAELCQSLGNPIRLRIIHSLKESPKSVGEISTEVELAQPKVSRHLSVLRENGVLTANRKGQEVFYEIANQKVVEVCEMMRSILAEREAQRLDLLSYFQSEEPSQLVEEVLYAPQHITP